jgi:hypothetical protein
MTEAQVTETVTETTPTPDQAQDAALDAAYDRAMASDEPDDEAEASGPARDEHGRFAKTEQTSEGASPPKEAEGQPDEETPEISNEAAPTAGLPANWRPDMADIWQKMPEPERERLGKWSQELHSRMSDMGRQVSQLRDFVPLVEHMTQAVPNKVGLNGVPPAQGLAALVDAAYRSAEEHRAINPREIMDEI